MTRIKSSPKCGLYSPPALPRFTNQRRLLCRCNRRSPRLKRIRARGAIRVGYLDDIRPFSFFNGEGKLVGLDVEMAHILASSLGVSLEFVPVDRTHPFQQLNERYCDIVMSGIVVTPERAEAASLSTPYMEETFAFVVQDHRRSEFSSREARQKLKAPKLAILDVPYLISFVREHLPKAQLVTVNSAEEFFESKGKTLDGFVYSAEGDRLGVCSIRNTRSWCRHRRSRYR